MQSLIRQNVHVVRGRAVQSTRFRLRNRHNTQNYGDLAHNVRNKPQKVQSWPDSEHSYNRHSPCRSPSENTAIKKKKKATSGQKKKQTTSCSSSAKIIPVTQMRLGVEYPKVAPQRHAALGLFRGLPLPPSYLSSDILGGKGREGEGGSRLFGIRKRSFLPNTAFLLLPTTSLPSPPLTALLCLYYYKTTVTFAWFDFSGEDWKPSVWKVRARAAEVTGLLTLSTIPAIYPRLSPIR